MSTARHRLQREREAEPFNAILIGDDIRVTLRQKGFIRQPDGSYSKVAPEAKPGTRRRRCPDTTGRAIAAHGAFWLSLHYLLARPNSVAMVFE